MATAAKMVFSHITKNPQVCGGQACIDQTRIRVIDIVVLEGQGYKPEDMQDVYAVPLTLAQIYSALAYADENRGEIDADFASGVVTEQEIERSKTEYFARHRGR